MRHYSIATLAIVTAGLALSGAARAQETNVCWPMPATRLEAFETNTDTVVIKATGVELSGCRATVIEVDFKAHKIKSQDWALAALAVLARQNKALTMDMLLAALKLRFKKPVYEMALAVTEKIAA